MKAVYALALLGTVVMMANGESCHLNTLATDCAHTSCDAGTELSCISGHCTCKSDIECQHEHNHAECRGMEGCSTLFAYCHNQVCHCAFQDIGHLIHNVTHGGGLGSILDLLG